MMAIDKSEIRRRLQEARAAKLERLGGRESAAVEREIRRRARRARVPTLEDVASLPAAALNRRKQRAQSEADRLKDAAMERWAAAEEIEAKLAEIEPDPPPGAPEQPGPPPGE